MSRPTRDTLNDARKYFPLRGIQALASIATVVVLARVMAPELYGTYVVLLAWSAVSSTFVFNWVTAASFRFYEESRLAGSLNGLYRDLISCYAMMAGVWILAGLIAITAVMNAGAGVSVPAVGWLVLLGLTDPVIATYQNIRMASRRIGSVAVVLLADTVLRGLLGLTGALLASDKVAGVLAGQFVASGLVAGALLFHVRTHVRDWHGRIDRARLWSFVSYGYPMAGMSLSSWVLSVSDRVLLGWLLGPANVGVYTVGYQLGSNAIQFPAASLMAGAFPVLIREHEQSGNEAASALLRRMVVVALIGGVVVVLAMAFGAHALVTTLFGASYAKAAVIVPAVAFGQLLLAISEYYAKGFQLSKVTSGLFRITLVAAVINVLANLALIPWLGIVGAALATIVSYGFALTLTARDCQEFLTVHFPNGSLIRIAVAALAPLVGLLWYWPGNGVVAGAATATAAVAAFFLALWAMREPTIVGALNALRRSNRPLPNTAQ